MYDDDHHLSYSQNGHASCITGGTDGGENVRDNITCVRCEGSLVRPGFNEVRRVATTRDRPS